MTLRVNFLIQTNVSVKFCFINSLLVTIPRKPHNLQGIFFYQRSEATSRLRD